MAELIDMAAEGLASWLWSQSASPGQDPLEVGMERARRDEGSFSYRNTHVAEFDGEVIAMLMGYRQPDIFELVDTSELPDPIRPLVELEAGAPASWYVNALAVRPQHRGRGIGRDLLRHARALAAETGARGLSLIAAEENEGAVRLYQREGYSIVDRRPLIKYAGCRHGGDWVLMTRGL